MSSSTLLLSLFKYKTWANEELFAEVGKMDPLAHQAERHAAIRILNHVYVVDRIFAAHLCGATHSYPATNTPDTPTLEELQAKVVRSDSWYMEKIAQSTPGQLAEKLSFTFTDGSLARMSREEMFAHVVTHGGYHRGAVGRILSQLSMAPPRDIFSGYLHQAEPARRV
jgi:uncharacterized damage-inducible protein DinB